MIKSFKHKGLELFFTTGNAKGINNQQANKIRERLSLLDTAQVIEDMNLPGLKLHPLKGNKLGLWSITVTGNFRIVFEFYDGNAYIVNYEDYH